MATSGANLPIHECFHSWQGEGAHLGRSAFFIRLFGCPVHCPWCDSAGTWHPDYIPKNVARVGAEELAQQAKASGAEFVVVTGGEPTIHDLTALCEALAEAGLPRHLETSGSFEIRGAFDWITLSPKWQKLPLEVNLAAASELKLIVENEASIEKWIQQLGPHLDAQRPVWLHPEWSQRDNPAVLESITRCVKERAAPFRAGVQAHKYYRADLLDPNARESAPLGGDEAKGY
ncbi:7-carboxy-7-deazaguanine synthase QueE [Pelagicoccus sp. SDUM812003]|uniref:7-carboxy-7-deazaguanine synthase QueE n=1 Tax=Pelagicoccus sp. SDUM812003 TaxID=3041267 RepID=UPI00280ED12C|nr:7-carboxy-7-deazaguanine synthase QueE [Pelagicoccus sp. SDUM812003]MDQ8202047.1 7-carboxy-7-deazaguanine synthase QueE [Pelagicoccus sp. SDUM812003]